ncbi:MAG: beta-ketoacyl-[acyl-carrier-protein] synthase family protein [Gammaproteobacteria bacterium]|nr:beta-ketoacyl-[acyl-carrier-protein] synthase family protein [Gammaproteobacteria bacterium]
MSARPVFVHGVGAVTALGLSWRESIAPLAAGASAIVPVTEFDVAHFPCTVAAPIRDFKHQGDRRIALACAASEEAWTAAAIAFDDSQQKKIGIFMGAESGRAPFATVHALTRAAGGKAAFDHAKFGKQARVLAEHCDASQTSPAAVTSLLAKRYGATGPAVTISLACSSGASAVAEAARSIRLGICDVALCGGVGADVDPLMLAGFGRIGALSGRGISCPFDARRDGFVVGEGAAMIVLSADRGTAVVELAGEGRSLDAYNLTAPDPDGDGATRAMRAALVAAKIDAVDYVQAHGTSTPLNDAVEAMALRRVFGTHLYKSHVSSVKGALGHWIAGAGALGLLCAHEALMTGTLFPTANLTNPDRDCDLPHVLGGAIKKTVNTALVNAFAFGGANCSLVLRRCA